MWEWPDVGGRHLCHGLGEGSPGRPWCLADSLLNSSARVFLFLKQGLFIPEQEAPIRRFR